MPGYIDVHDQRFDIEYEVNGGVLLYRWETKPGQLHQLARLAPVGAPSWGASRNAGQSKSDDFTFTITEVDPGDPDAVMLARAIATKKGYTIRE